MLFGKFQTYPIIPPFLYRSSSFSSSRRGSEAVLFLNGSFRSYAQSGRFSRISKHGSHHHQNNTLNHQHQIPPEPEPEPEPEPQPQPKKGNSSDHIISTWLSRILWAIPIMYVIQEYGINVVRVSGRSMEPELHSSVSSDAWKSDYIVIVRMFSYSKMRQIYHFLFGNVWDRFPINYVPGYGKELKEKIVVCRSPTSNIPSTSDCIIKRVKAVNGEVISTSSHYFDNFISDSGNWQHWVNIIDHRTATPPRPEDLIVHELFKNVNDNSKLMASGGGGGGDRCEIEVPAGAFWIQGDNESYSVDSRRYGPIPMSLLRGVALCRIRPSAIFKSDQSSVDGDSLIKWYSLFS